METDTHLAKFYERKTDYIKCVLCPRFCALREGKTGFCGVRKNVGDKLVSLNYGEISSIALDPIEKKPLRRFMPGTMILSCGSFGCNLSCDFCQNHSIAQATPRTIEFKPEELVEKALEFRDDGNIGIAYTYNEPIIWYEYVYDCAVLAKSKGLKNILVSNGYINQAPLIEILPYISAMNIDLKGDQRLYSSLCKAPSPPPARSRTAPSATAPSETEPSEAARSETAPSEAARDTELETTVDTEQEAARGAERKAAHATADDIVKANIELAANYCHVEVTLLIVPDWDDDIEFIDSTAKWIASISREMPLHLSRFFPRNRMEFSRATNVEFIREAANVAARRLKYVYMGNV